LQLSELVKALSDPAIYPEPPQRVEVEQTQMSIVLLAGEYVYKVKKPVNLGYLDYTTLESRRFYCQREVELNRRLCPEAYLGVVAITRAKDQIVLDGAGRPIEYAVKMRRLPQEAMMDVLLAKGKVSPQMIAGVAQRLERFHRETETNPTISAFGDIETVSRNTSENFEQTAPYIGRTISQEQYAHIKEYTEGFININAPLFHQRINKGRIRDCHGDLHAAHICFTDNICIYDCIEFNDRFRYGDVASEVAFLAMDLDRYGAHHLSRTFVDTYVKESKDRELLTLLNFYKCYRAYVRGKVEGFKLDDPLIADKEKGKTLAAARMYFELAESYTSKDE
jgi:aminoglycoside phosphotransferase family enzyme